MEVEEPQGKQVDFKITNDMGTVSYYFTITGIYKVCLKFDILSQNASTPITTLDIMYYISDTEVETSQIPIGETIKDDVAKLNELDKFMGTMGANINKIRSLQEQSLSGLKLFKDKQVELSEEISYFTLIECALVVIAGLIQGFSLRSYFHKKNIK